MSEPKNIWPKNVKPITWDGFNSLGVDDKNKLYWDGLPVETKQTIKFSFWQKLGTIIIVLATICGGVGGLAAGIDSLHNFGCKMNFWQQGCSK